MTQDDTRYELSMGIPNGIILSLIGALLLLTPVVVAVPKDKVAMDYVAGAVLLAGGILSLTLGLRSRRKKISA